MIQPSSLFVVDADVRSLETLTFGFEREGCKVTGTSDLRRAEQMARTTSAQVAIVSLRDPEPSSLALVAALRAAAKELPIVVLGPHTLKSDALRAGAADFLALPTFLRDVIGVGKLSALSSKASRAGDAGKAATASSGDELQTRLSEHYGLFYLLRAMASSERSGILSLTRGNRRAELRIHEGTVVSASVGAMQGLPALHHLLLWEEAALSLARRAIPKHSQLHLSAQEILDECERFLRDFAHAARDLGAPRTLYVPAAEPVAELRGLQPSQVTPLLRLFDGRRVLADVIEASPFRIFDTVRLIRRLRDGGALVIRPDEPAHDRKEPHAAAAPEPGKNGAVKSMLGEWAMVPDQRGVVGDRRTTNRKLRPLDPVTPAPVPIPLTTKKGGSAAGEISAARRKPTPPAASVSLLEVAPTVQVQLDAAGVPLGEPLVPSDRASFPASKTPPPIRARSASGRYAPVEDAPPPRVDRTSDRTSDRTPAPVRARSGSGRHAPVEDRTPRPRRVTGDNQNLAPDEFDAIEADFFAREADLYKREAIETFDDLEPVAGLPGRPRKK